MRLSGNCQLLYLPLLGCQPISNFFARGKVYSEDSHLRVGQKRNQRASTSTNNTTPETVSSIIEEAKTTQVDVVEH